MLIARIAIIFLGILLVLKILKNIITVVKEKIALANNTIIIESNYISPEDLEKIEIKVFILGDKKYHVGDTIEIITQLKERISGMVLGLDNTGKTIILADNKNIRKIEFKKIHKIKLISRYGKFFNLKNE